MLIIGEADNTDGMLADWESQGTSVADSNVSSLHNAMLIVGEVEDSDFYSPPQSSASQSHHGMGEVSSSNISSAEDKNSDDPNARAKDLVTCKSTSQCYTELD